MRSQLLLILGIVAPLLVLAQSKNLSGRILENANAKAIEFAQIFIPKTAIGTISDEKGNFTLSIPDNISADSFSIFVLGYKSRTLSIVDFQSSTDKNIGLVADTYSGAEVEITAKGCQNMKVINWGTTSNTGPGLFSASLGSQVAMYFPNSKSKSGYIKKVSFFISSDGIPDTKFRVRIYYADGENAAPKSDLLVHNIVAHAEAGNEWVNIDVSSYNLEVPSDGFFVAMEWLPENSPKAEYGVGHIRGQVLCAMLESKKTDDLTWSCDFLSGNWNQHQKMKNQKNTIHPMIRAEVSICPK